MTTTLTSEPTPDLRPAPTRRRRRRRRRIVAATTVAVLLGAASGGMWWFFRDNAPAPVEIATAAEGAGDGAAAATGAIDVTGSWSVDTSVGTFAYDDSTGTFAGFRVDEELSGIGSTTAVGRTPEVSGRITIDGTTLTAATIEADMTAITTNDSRRDDRVQDALETATYPTATFVLTEPIDLGTAAMSGEATAVTAVGDLTVHGVTTSVSIPLEVQLVDDTIVVVGSLDITFSDYGVTVPSAPVVLSASDGGVLELQLYFSRG